MHHNDIIRGLQSSVDKRAAKIFELEFFEKGYKELGKKAAVRATKEELKHLREEQAVQKRALGIVLQGLRAMQRYDYVVNALVYVE